MRSGRMRYKSLRILLRVISRVYSQAPNFPVNFAVEVYFIINFVLLMMIKTHIFCCDSYKMLMKSL